MRPYTRNQRNPAPATHPAKLNTSREFDKEKKIEIKEEERKRHEKNQGCDILC